MRQAISHDIHLTVVACTAVIGSTVVWPGALSWALVFVAVLAVLGLVGLEVEHEPARRDGEAS